MVYLDIMSKSYSPLLLDILDYIDDCVIIINDSGKIVFYNKARERLEGMKREHVIGKPFRSVYKEQNTFSATMQCKNKNKPVLNVYQNYTTQSGKNISSVSSAYPIQLANEEQGVIAITKDISYYNFLLQSLPNHMTPLQHKNNSADFHFHHILGKNPMLIDSIHLAKTAAKTNSNILIYGETGTGKELYAQSIHNASLCSGPFVSINCAAIPDNLLESILFGTSQGAYTGSVEKQGLFEEAKDGTLFLDELNSMNINLQSKLLRAVETGYIRRVGENKERQVRTKIVTAINVHPIEAIKNKTLRRDLFYRLGVVTVEIPPLRNRKDDIPLLLDYFLKKFNKKLTKDIAHVSNDVLTFFLQYDWPGNVREFEHVIEHSAIVCTNNEINLKDLPLFIQNTAPLQKVDNNESSLSKELSNSEIDYAKSIDEFLVRIEAKMIKNKLEEYNWNVSKTAQSLGLTRQTLDYRIKKYRIR